MVPNQQRMMGPKTLPIWAVPLLCTRKSTARIATVSGTMKRANAGVATSSPSTAERTLIAGVMMPSPKRSPAASIRSESKRREPLPAVRVQEAVESECASLTVVVRAEDEDEILERHDERDRPDDQRDAAEHVVGRAQDVAVPEEDLVDRVERRRADVAIDDAHRTDRQRNHAAVRSVVLRRVGGERPVPRTIHAPWSVHDDERASSSVATPSARRLRRRGAESAGKRPASTGARRLGTQQNGSSAGSCTARVGGAAIPGGQRLPHFEELDVGEERGVPRDSSAHAGLSVSHLRRDRELALAADPHAEKVPRPNP